MRLKSRGRHARKPTRVERLRTGFSGAAAVVIAIAIFILTSQTPEVTSAESGFMDDLMVSLLGWIPGLYDPTTGLWLGVGIRHWAHAVEYGALGLFVALAAKSAMGRRTIAPGMAALAICAGLSLFDQCHRLFVPGRHFDPFDLAMDALGYGVAVVVMMGVMMTRECGK
ncbi:MAG: VanZ family protein [Bacteroidales bacterium]|nr:VanZ family protein [Bacteroidales bacterium]